MKEKQVRLQRIKDIISIQTIRSQDDLLKLLIEEGYDLTQGTLSRDLKSLMVAKTIDEDGAYKYIIQDDVNKPQTLRNGFQSIDFSGNLVVLKTLPGYANPLAVIIDNHEHKMIVGCVAGDDTIILVMDEEYHDREIVREYLYSIIKG